VVADGGGVQMVVTWQAGSCIVILRGVHIGIGICHLSFTIHTVSTCDPPCEQLLTVVVVGARGLAILTAIVCLLTWRWW
jgi:hypothetical protein